MKINIATYCRHIAFFSTALFKFQPNEQIFEQSYNQIQSLLTCCHLRVGNSFYCMLHLNSFVCRVRSYVSICLNALCHLSPHSLFHHVSCRSEASQAALCIRVAAALLGSCSVNACIIMKHRESQVDIKQTLTDTTSKNPRQTLKLRSV